MGKHKKIKVGDKFTVRPDVEVTVVEYYNAKAVIVEDAERNRRECQASDLKSGNITWLKKDGSFKKYVKKIGKRPSPKVGERYKSEHHGWFVILKIEGYNNMTIRFEDTGAEKSGVYTHIAFSGKVADPSKPRYEGLLEKYPIGSVWESYNWGEFEIVDIKSAQDVTIRWALTGRLQHCVSTASIRKGFVVDHDRYEKEVNYLHPEEGKHYIYVAKLDGQIIYVGQGFGKRYLHCKGGWSHNVELNRLYFEGRDVVVEIYKDGISKAEATELEKNLISTLKPYCNKRVYNVYYFQIA